jgi:hypothetical protein
VVLSLLWEVTLAVPYNSWNFQHHRMIGLFIGAWSGQPIEEVCVWIAVTYATAIVFEVIRVLLASERSVRDMLIGQKDSGNGRPGTGVDSVTDRVAVDMERFQD